METYRDDRRLTINEHLWLQALDQTTHTRTQAAAAADTADKQWRAVIRDAIQAGVRVTDIATTTGLSKARVYQIRDGRR